MSCNPEALRALRRNTIAGTIHSALFITAVVGNILTCIVIVRNKFMHTATNYYLLSLAISDLCIITLGLSSWVYHSEHQSAHPAVDVCAVRLYMIELTTHVSIFTIAAFTVERYIAICHPFTAHKTADPRRTIKFIILIWIMAACLTIPQSINYFVENCDITYQPLTSIVPYIKYSFEISLLVLFVGPTTILAVLYILIAQKLREPKGISSTYVTDQKKIFKMLVAVVVSFFVCWAPYQGYRIYRIHFLKHKSLIDMLGQPTLLERIAFHVVIVLYLTSTAINPILYNLMSSNFRKAFKCTFFWKPEPVEPISWKGKEFDDKKDVP